MKLLIKIIIFILLLLPLGITAVVPISPLSVVYRQANQTIKESLAKSDETAEQDALIKVLEFTPWEGSSWLRLGRLYLNSGEYDRAIDAFSRAEKLNALTTQGRVWQADAFISNGKVEKAKNVLRGLPETDDVFLLLQTANLQRQINDTYGALATLLRAYPLDPLNAELNFQLGVQLAAKEPANALQYLQFTVEQNPSRQREAQTLIEIIISAEGLAGTGEQFLYIGQILSQFEEWDVAVLSFQNAVTLSPVNADAWALLSEAQQQTGQDGYGALTKALGLDPGGEIVNGIAALYYRRQQKPELALLYLDKAIAANPSAAVWLIEKGNTLAGNGDLENAILQFQKAAELNAEDWSPWRALAVFCFSHNYQVSTTGMDAARQALVLNPDSPQLVDLLGTGFMMLGDYDSAERFFLKADELDPEEAAILIHLGQVYLYRNESEIAFGYLRKAVEVAQDSRLREFASRLLRENGAN